MKRVLCTVAVPLLVCAQSREEGPRSREEKKVLLEATVKEKGGDLYGAIALLEQGLVTHPRADRLRGRLDALNRKIYLSPAQPGGTSFYTVVSGDSLSRIARRYAITVGLLRRLNGLKNDNLRVEQRLKVVKGPFDVRVDKQGFTLHVLSGKKVLFSYPVCLGADNSTPEGTFVVGPRLTKPTQYDRESGKAIAYGQPGHTLGTHWITFSGEYGIHGTVDPESIGTEGSRGCVRMLNKHVAEVFDLLVTGKSKVTISPGKPPPATMPAAGTR